MEAAIFSEMLSAIYESTQCRPRRFKYPKKKNGGLLEIGNFTSHKMWEITENS